MAGRSSSGASSSASDRYSAARVCRPARLSERPTARSVRQVRDRARSAGPVCDVYGPAAIASVKADRAEAVSPIARKCGPRCRAASAVRTPLPARRASETPRSPSSSRNARRANREQRGVGGHPAGLHDRVGQREHGAVLRLGQYVEPGQPQPRRQLRVFALGERELLRRLGPPGQVARHPGELHARGWRRRPIDRPQVRAVVLGGPACAVEPGVRAREEKRGLRPRGRGRDDIFHKEPPHGSPRALIRKGSRRQQQRLVPLHLARRQLARQQGRGGNRHLRIEEGSGALQDGVGSGEGLTAAILCGNARREEQQQDRPQAGAAREHTLENAHRQASFHHFPTPTTLGPAWPDPELPPSSGPDQEPSNKSGPPRWRAALFKLGSGYAPRSGLRRISRRPPGEIPARAARR